MLRVAEEALRRGHPDQAIIAYQMAAARFRMMGQRLKETSVLQNLVRLQPDDLETLRELVNAYDELGRRQEAAGARLRLAAALRQRGMVSEADRLEKKARAQAFSLGGAAASGEDDDTGAIAEMPGDPVSLGQVEDAGTVNLDLDGHTRETPMVPTPAPGVSALAGDWDPARDLLESTAADRERGLEDDTSAFPSALQAVAGLPEEVSDHPFEGEAFETLAMPVVDRRPSKDPFDNDETASLRAMSKVGDLDMSELSFDIDEEPPHSPDVTLAMKMSPAPRAPSLDLPSEFDVESTTTTPPDERPVDTSLADADEDTDAAPIPKQIPGIIAERTMLDGLPAALDDDDQEFDPDEPPSADKTRAYNADEIEQLQHLLNQRR